LSSRQKGRFDIYDALVIHRVGPLAPRTRSFSSPLRARIAARRSNAVCRFIIDYLKTEAPFWKKEETPEGARWSDARTSDMKRLPAGPRPESTRSIGVAPGHC
jgi:molybdopterin synthase catalytic subunit